MANRARIRVGRKVAYLPTNAEATTGNGNAGDRWAATITSVSASGLVNLSVHEADGGFIAKTGVAMSEAKGGFSLAQP